MCGHPKDSLTYSLENVYMEQLTTHAKHIVVFLETNGEHGKYYLFSLRALILGREEWKADNYMMILVKMKYD